MSNLIDREKAIEDLQNGDPSETYEIEDIKYWLKSLPSAEPEIIRCKDCRFEDGVWYCNIHFMDIEPNGFCHLAERKERR